MGRPTQDVDVFTIQDRRVHGKAKPWVVRWRVDGQQRTKSFRTRAEADRYRSVLVHAVTRGERFDHRTGEPVSWSAATILGRARWAPPSGVMVNLTTLLSRDVQQVSHRHVAEDLAHHDAASPKSGRVSEPSASRVKPGLWATSHTWPSGSRNQPA